MTVTALIIGKLLADPEQRTSNAGKPFTTARVAADSDGESVLASVIAFGSTAQQLAALGKGDTLAFVGRAKAKAWTGKDGEVKSGLDVVVDQILTPYHLKRRRAAMQGDADSIGSGNEP